MTKAELEQKVIEQQKIIDARKKKVKDQNEAAKKNWQTVSCRLPKGTKERIKSLGLPINGLIKRLVLAELDRLETEAAGMPQNVKTAIKKREAEESTQVDEKVENKPHNELQDITPEQPVIRPELPLLTCSCKTAEELKDQQIKDDKHGRL